MGATKIMVIRHAEKPDSYGSTGTAFYGVDPTGSLAGNPDGDKHLITQGGQRVGALVTLFAPLRGTVAPPLAKPQFLFASDPGKMHEGRPRPQQAAGRDPFRRGGRSWPDAQHLIRGYRLRRHDRGRACLPGGRADRVAARGHPASE
jgi:hypothetical protein